MGSKGARKRANASHERWLWSWPTTRSREALWEMSFLYVPTLGWCGLWLWFLAQLMPLLTAIPLAAFGSGSGICQRE